MSKGSEFGGLASEERFSGIFRRHDGALPATSFHLLGIWTTTDRLPDLSSSMARFIS